MEGNIPEEDGVDHRVEPLWLTDGSAEGPPGGLEAEQASPQPAPGDPAEDADPLLTDLPMPGSSYAAAGQEPPFSIGEEVSYGGQDGQYGPGLSGQDEPYLSGGGGQGVPYGSGGTGQGVPYGPGGPDIPYHPAGHEPSANGDGIRVPPYQPTVPPLPAQVPPTPSPGMARVTAPFAALTRPKAKNKKPARPPTPASHGPLTRTGPTERIPPAGRPSPARTPVTAPTRRAQLVLARIEPWSVMKFSFMISLVGWVILFVAVAALYYVLSKLGVFHSIQSTITDVTSSKGSAGSDANGQWFSASRILGYTMLVGAVNVVLITALATVGAVIYNLVTHLAGGIEVTLKETD
jgi:Transmembrane domain of unknown function (DUF3566)